MALQMQAATAAMIYATAFQIGVSRGVCTAVRKAPSDEGAVERSETEGEIHRKFLLCRLSLRLLLRKIHLPRQREA